MAGVRPVGLAAAGLTSISFVPQAWLSFKTRDVSGVSLGMYSVFTFGVALWLAYGLLLQAWPVVIANAIIRAGQPWQSVGVGKTATTP